MTEQLHFDFSLSCVGEGNGNPLSVLSWRILGTGKPGGLQSMGSHRVGHDWRDLVAAAAAVLKIRSLKSDLFRSHLISWPHFVTSLTPVAVSLRWQERWAPLHSSFWGIKDSVVERNFKDCQGYNISAVKVRKITKCNELYHYQLIIISVVLSRETKVISTLQAATINGQVSISTDPAARGLPGFPHSSFWITPYCWLITPDSAFLTMFPWCRALTFSAQT